MNFETWMTKTNSAVCSVQNPQFDEATGMDGIQGIETEVQEQAPASSRRWSGAVSLCLIAAVALALHGALFSTLDVIAPLELESTEEAVLVVDAPFQVDRFIADAR